MRIQFRNWKPRQEAMLRVIKIREILKDLREQGIERVTLRQLYYQLVSQVVIANKEQEYKNLSALLTNARYAGLIPWDAIEDRTRVPKKPREYDNVKQLVKAAVYSYELDYWQGQSKRVEVWVEKEALSNVMSLAIEDLHGVLCVNKGYSSGSAMFENAQRIYEHMKTGQAVEILYSGDHDPSGLDMVRDVRERLFEFIAGLYAVDEDNIPEDADSVDKDDILKFMSGFTVSNIALTMEQIEEHEPPPNPTKAKDTRADDYVSKYGRECWELDALPPAVLNELVRTEVEERIEDRDLFDEVIERQKREIQALTEYSKTL